MKIFGLLEYIALIALSYYEWFNIIKIVLSNGASFAISYQWVHGFLKDIFLGHLLHTPEFIISQIIEIFLKIRFNLNTLNIISKNNIK